MFNPRDKDNIPATCSLLKVFLVTFSIPSSSKLSAFVSVASSYPLFLLFSGDVAPFDLPVTEEVTQVAEDGQDAVAHVGEDRHQHGRLLKRLNEGPAVQAVMMGGCVDLGDMETGKFTVPMHHNKTKKHSNNSMNFEIWQMTDDVNSI